MNNNYKRYQVKQVKVSQIVFFMVGVMLLGYGEDLFSRCSNKELPQSNALRNDCQRLSDLQSIATALEESFTIHLNYTQPETRYVDSSIQESGKWSTKSDLLLLVKEGVLDRLPLDPLNNREYFYFYEVLNNLNIPDYHLCVSNLETTGHPYCVASKKYHFYSDHVFVRTDILFKNQTIRIISANILYGGGDPIAPETRSALEEQCEILKKNRPDMVAFQEVEIDTARVLGRSKELADHSEIEYFKKNLQLYHDHFTPYKKFLIGSSGKLILSKYNILSTMDINRHLSVVGVDLDSNQHVDFFIANMHVKPHHHTHQSITEIIERSIEKLLHLYGEHPIVLLGDFAINNLALKVYGFEDTYQICGEKNQHGLQYKNTFIGKKAKRFDYIFIRKLKCKKLTHTIIIPNQEE